MARGAGFSGWTMACLAASILAACATAPRKPSQQPSAPEAAGRVSGRVVEAPPDERYAARPGATYEQPIASPDNPLPRYPAPQLARRLPVVEVQARLVVDEHGAVTRVEMEDGANDASFVAAVQAAVMRWSFIPLIEVMPGPGETTIPLGDAMLVYQGAARALPFHRDYVFRFEQENGRGKVSSEAAKP